MSATPYTTVQKKALFLAEFQKTWGNVSKACVAAGIGRQTYYDWCKSKAFQQQLADAKEATKDMAESQVLTVVQGYTLPETKVFMVPVKRTEIIKGKPVIVETREPVLVPLKKHVGPDGRVALKYLEAQARERGYGREVEIKHTGVLDIKTIILQEVLPTHQLQPPAEYAQLATPTGSDPSAPA